MEIRKSTPADIPAMMALFESARGIMRSDGNMEQWSGGYPSEELVMRDISLGNSYIVEQGGCPVATFAFIVGVDPTYLKIVGGDWLENTLTYGTIHRLASAPDSHGVARACFDWCWSQCRNLRADTHRDNHIMQHVLESNGFRYCGIIYLADGAERLAYQKI